MLPPINVRIARELSEQGQTTVTEKQITAAVTLLDEGSTVPFIARYRKEVTGALDDSQLRELQTRLIYLRELEDRRETIVNSIQEQGKLTDELSTKIKLAETKTLLEDLYLPYKPKRRTKGQIAIEAGLEPLAEGLLSGELMPDAADSYINDEAGYPDAKTILEGARYILMERFAEDAELLAKLRQDIFDHGVITAIVQSGKEQDGAKFRDYFEFQEAIKKIPSHRVLALLRGRNEGILRINLLSRPPVEDNTVDKAEILIGEHTGLPVNAAQQTDPRQRWLAEVVRWTWKIKLSLQIETDLLLQLRQQAEEEAIQVFGNNLKDLLLAAPAGTRVTMGLDPAYRTGVKVAVVDSTGKFLENTTIYPHQPQKKWDASLQTLAQLCKKHQVELISIGNGTASRETDALVVELLEKQADLNIKKLVVSEAGASVYSASEFAAQEYPDLDVTVRGAISIAHRLQDPLAELVKIDPKAIGVGQYQHDVNQTQLLTKLDTVVEDCVNAVGVDVNTASVPLLSRVAGLSTSIAQNIVRKRDELQGFSSRQQLLEVPRLGPKAFEQAAGFLRLRDGSNVLDASSVHPESYHVVERMAKQFDRSPQSLIGDRGFLKSIKPADFTDTQTGEMTVKDILQELEKPGRDPRPEFKTATFKADVSKVSDLKPGMKLEGVVTNVTNFGAFVDIGVHQDGLVHVSALSDQFVKNPQDVVRAGDVVNVTVMEVDVDRKRIGLSMKSNADAHDAKPAGMTQKPKAQRRNKRQASQRPSAPQGAMADALARAFDK